MGSYISYLFVDSEELPNNPGGFVQLLFLMAAYSFFLYQGSHLISDGSELLLLVPSIAGIVGSVVLPVLGAVPDGAIVLFSGLGADAQTQLTVGVGALAGSTVMLLTLPWALCIFSGRVDLDEQGECNYKKPAGAAKGWSKLTPSSSLYVRLFKSGIPMARPMRINAAILALTAIAYLIIQVPGFQLGCGKGDVCEHGAGEKYWALGGCLFATASFIAYLVYQVRVGAEDETHQSAIEEKISAQITAGHVGVADAFFAFMHQEHVSSGSLISRQESQSLLHHEAPSASDVSLQFNTNGAAGAYGAAGKAGSAGAAPPKSEALLRTERKMHKILRRFFRVYDRDGSDSIDLTELQLLLKDIGTHLSPDAQRALFKSMDVSGDGQVSFDEFASCILMILQHPELTTALEAKAAAEEKQKADQALSGAATAEAKIAAARAHRMKSMANLNALLLGDKASSGFAVPAPAASPNAAAASSSPTSPHVTFAKDAPSTVGMKSLTIADGGDSDDEKEDEEEEEEEEEVPEDLLSLTPEAQQRAIKFRAAWMMSLGTALILLFSDPMVDCLSQLGARTHIPVFYVSFLLAPLAANASELMAAVNYAAKKTKPSITISLTSLEGSATMNNTFCLLIFLALVFFKDLQWVFSAETIAILAVEMAVAAMTMKKVHTGMDAWILLSFYPLSMGLVAFLENVVGLN